MKNKLFVFILVLGFIAGNLFAQDKILELKKNIQEVIDATKCDVSCVVISAEKYDLLFDYNAYNKMIPASITKVITSSTALAKLGTGYQFNTVIYTDDSNISDGEINGNIYIKGYGDPDLTTEDVESLAQKVAALHIKLISGNVIYDNSFLDDNHYGLSNGFYSSDTDPKYWPYICALSINKNKSKDPSYYAANVFAKELVSQGIDFKGIIISGVTPQSPKELTKNSRPIAKVLTDMNKPSDNHSAITVFKVIGAETYSAPGSLEKGSKAVIDFLTSIGADREGYDILEGSGLSRYNFVTADVYVLILKYMFDKDNLFETFYNSLPIAGVDGTLGDRMKGTEAERNVHAKTGTLNYVSTLTGYAITRDGEPLIFYIAMNNFTGDRNVYRKKQDKICEILCKFSRK